MPEKPSLIRSPAAWNRLADWLQARDLDSGVALLAIRAIIGVIAGLGVVAFYLLIDGSYAVLTAWPDGMRLSRRAQLCESAARPWAFGSRGPSYAGHA